MIIPEKFYRVSEIIELAREGFFPIKDRHTISKLIKSGKLKAMDTGAEEKKIWHISGSELLAYLKTSSSFEEKEKSNVPRKKTKSSKEKNEKSLQTTQGEVQS